jgi:phosphoribosylglycinamide formyltransferase-1
MPRLPIVVLLSGEGSNFVAIATAIAEGRLHARIAAVVSDRPAARGLERARLLGLPAHAIPPADYPDRASHDRALMACIDAYAPALVVLAGYMRIFTPPFIARYAERMLNIHPSLLPAFTGLHTHQRALDAGVERHGCSVHYVTDELDGGPLVAQASVPVLPGDTAASLAQRVHRAEHRLYPTVIEWVAQGRLRAHDGRAWLDGVPLAAPVQLAESPEGGSA